MLKTNTMDCSSMTLQGRQCKNKAKDSDLCRVHSKLIGGWQSVPKSNPALWHKGASRRKQRDLAPLRRALDLCTHSVVCGPFPCPFPLTRLQDCNAHGPCAVRGLCKCQPQTALQVTAQARYRQDRIEAVRTVDSH